MQVQVQVDESDVAAVSTGNTATFEVGSYPECCSTALSRRCGCNLFSSSLEGLLRAARPPPRPRRLIRRRARQGRARRRAGTGYSRRQRRQLHRDRRCGEQGRATASGHDRGGHLRRRHARECRPDSEQRPGVPPADRRARGDRRARPADDRRAPSQEAGRRNASGLASTKRDDSCRSSSRAAWRTIDGPSW